MIRFLISLLGVGAASSLTGCMYGSPAVEYGTPFATFKVNGIVQSEQTSEGIPGIRVIMEADTTYTDVSGHYLVQQQRFPEERVFTVEFDDVDGEMNGSFISADTIAEFIDPEFTGGTDGWNSGETEKEINVKLKDKK